MIDCRDKERVIEYFIDSLLFIHLRNYRFLLALFENNYARVLDADTFEIVQELQFKSDYAQPAKGGVVIEKVINESKKQINV